MCDTNYGHPTYLFRYAYVLRRTGVAKLAALCGSRVPARIIVKNDTHDGENLRSRQTLCATLLHPTSGLPIVEVPRLYDVRLLSLTSDELIISGIERPEGLVQTNYAQCWVATPIELAVTPDWVPGGDAT